MDHIRRVDGFHGTSRENAEKILEEGFHESTNIYDWLGRGVYFFKDAPITAWKWAERHCKKHGGDPAVLRSVIRLEACMDLLDEDTSWGQALHEAHESFLEMTGFDPPENRGGRRELDCRVIDHACKIQERYYNRRIKSVLAAFIEVDDEGFFPGSQIYKGSHVQIAVRDLSVIESTELCMPAIE